jgi:hypothetical protein
LLTAAGSARADDAPAAEPAQAEPQEGAAKADAEAEEPAAKKADDDGDGEEQEDDSDEVRFRGGISGGGGGLFVSGFVVGMGGVDGRLGVQIMDLVGLYVQPHLALGSGTYDGVTLFTGALGGSLVVDFTFIDQLFVGAGPGISWLGSLTDPAPEIHVRFGGYPVVGDGEGGRRKGFMIGGDVRVYFVGDITVVEPFVSLGYEAF